MIRGVAFDIVDAKSLNDTEKSILLDRYNTFMGSLFAIVSMPFQQAAALFMPVLFLSCASSAVLSKNKSFLHTWAPVGATLALSLLLGQGMNAVNVQFDSVRIEPVIGSNDLVSNNNGSLSANVANITNSASIAGIPSTDTILRNVIQSTTSDAQTTCTWTTG